MIDFDDLPDNIGDLLHEAFAKAAAEPAQEDASQPSSCEGKAAEEEAASEAPSEEGPPDPAQIWEAVSRLTDRVDQLLSHQRRMQAELNFLQTEQDEAQTLLEEYLKKEAARDAKSAADSRRFLHAAGVTTLLAPPLFGLGCLLAWIMQCWAGAWGIPGSILLACISCISLGLFLLVLAKCSSRPFQALLRWLEADEWPEGPKEDFLGKEP